MALTIGECTLALVFITTWLLIQANIDVCPKGNVIAKPSHVISLGSAVNISCSLKNNASANKLILEREGIQIASGRGSFISARVTHLPLGKTLFVCKLVSAHRAEIWPVCGVVISVGVVPEQPQNLSCEQTGERGTVACTWSRGRDTYLYTLQFNGPKNLTCQKQCRKDCPEWLDLGINLTSEYSESTFTAKVTATNSLGNTSSLLSTFTFSDIVKPLPPWNMRTNFLNASSSRCTLQWEDEGWVLLNRLRYRPKSSSFWNMVNVTTARGKHDLLDLKPFTEYEFQISSKLHYKGSWSEWSESLRIQTPEAEPTGTLDIWYTKQHVDYNRQQISVFWKNLSVSEARGQILYYQVTLQEVTGRKIILQNITGYTSWTWVIPRTGTWTAAVSAANSRGSSLPTYIKIMDLCSTGSLAPREVFANSEGMDDIVVAWRPPRKATFAIQEYVVEWKSFHPEASMQPPLNWLRVPSYNVSALVSEPQSGPRINTITEESGSAFVFWNHIPIQNQMGCILHYKIYWKERDSKSQPELCEIPYKPSQNSFSINKLHTRVTYILWMTALTAAGESPQGNVIEFRLQGKATWKAFVVSSICTAIVIVGIFSTQYFRQKVFVLLSALRPQWCSREIPDPANSTWAKKYPIVEEKMQLPWDWIQMALCAPEEPEPLVINEVLQMTPIFQHSQCTKWPERRPDRQGHFTSKEDIAYSSSSLQPSRVLTAETRQLYKVLGSRGPDSKPENPASPLMVLPVDYLPNHEGYLPSHIEELPPQEAPLTDPLEELEPQHISLSIFASHSLHPLTSCGEKLTLDQLKMGCDSLLH
ncbi:interleukin-12 receptor subunit beta-2 isoform X2 [Dipodomys spectabilis]|uniref:interleukin-12 receptor subunit beta-2 isoform X2 n=1 Tax=Dipodomys spectabilis TaxID=105255 RepID=UPI001C53EEC2|nr:interleukin-12 receptor subunit beta-2 isoform X2 [Dipodomys spectabilis]